jgi:transposase InsO family protein
MDASLGELDTLRNLAAQLSAAPHGGRTALVDQAATVLRVSRQEVYRRLKSVGFHSGRKPRSDRGRSLVSEGVAMQAAALVQGARRKTGKKTLPLKLALEILRDNGQGEVDPQTGEVLLPLSATTLSRAMRRHGCHPAMLVQGKPHAHLRSEHPNHVWQVDASLCVLFYLPRQGLHIMPEDVFYKNKPKNIERVSQERVWRYVVTDHYSGAFYLLYVQSAGETAENLAEVFLQAIQQRGPDDPMHGVPRVLMMDMGAANTSHLFLNLLERLGVEPMVHEPGNSRAKGQVEQAQNLVETQFEGRLAFSRIDTLEQLQASADRWRIHYNAWAVHSRTRQTRNALWLSIQEEQLRLAPSMELCRDLVTTRPVEATVRPDMTITHSIKGFGRNTYDLRYVNGLAPKMKVAVVVNPYRAPAVDIAVRDGRGEETIWTIEPVRMTEAGFRADAAIIGHEHKALPDTLADKRVKEIEAAVGDSGRERQTGKAPYGLDVFADVAPAPAYLPRRGRELALDASRREIPPLSHVEAAKMLKARLGSDWNADRFAWLAQRWPGGVPPQEIDLIVAQLSGPGQTKALPLRVVGGESKGGL